MNLSELFGRLHPLVLHFPITLIVLSALVELVRLKWDRPAFGQLVAFLLVVGSLGAAAATATGWVFAHESYPRPSLRWALEWHRWLGVATTAVSAIAAWIACRHAQSTSARCRWLRRLTVWLAAMLLTGAAHLGALLVWGEDYFSPDA